MQEIEKQQVRKKIVSNLLRKIVQKATATYVNDDELVADRKNAKSGTSTAAQTYNDLDTVSRGNIQEEKSKFFSLKWCQRARDKVIENTKQQIIVKDKVLHQKIARKTKRLQG